VCISIGGRKTIGGCGHLGSTTNISATTTTVVSFVVSCYITKKTILILETCWHQPRLLTSQMFGISLNNLLVQDLENEYKGGPLDYLLSKGLE
jgi:hypothetical protein